MTKWNVSFFGAMLFTFASVCSAAASNTALQNAMGALKVSATRAQYDMFAEAISASPELTNQLNDLAARGLLTAFRIDPSPSQAASRKPFSARRDGSVWAFTPPFLQQQAKARLYDVVQPDDVLPDNMVFALGHLAFKTNTAASVLASEQSLQVQLHTGRQGAPGMALPHDGGQLFAVIGTGSPAKRCRRVYPGVE